jgi:hypothetical protein
MPFRRNSAGQLDKKTLAIIYEGGLISLWLYKENSKVQD